MKKKQLIFGLVLLVALIALVVWGRDRIHFDFGVFVSQLKMADWRKIGIAFVCIYICYVFRAVRWALLLRHIKKVPLFSLLSTQVIGFAAIALLGRVAEPVRPYLVAKKTSLTFTSQVAIYLVERLLDAGSMVLIFSATILLAAWFGGDGARRGLPTVQSVANALNISPNYLSELLTVLTGQSTQQHIHDRLIEKAKAELSTTDLTVSEIAFRLGFEHSQSFSKLFRKKTNFSPLEFRSSVLHH